MGQIFNACIYDIDSMTCCRMDADTFHTNCYSFSSAVVSAHYLLRHKPYRVMWGSNQVLLDDDITEFLRMEDLLGLSTYISYEDIERSNENLREKNWLYNARFIGENHRLWDRINVWKKASRYFDWKNTRSVKYNGYLLNHTQKLAVSLDDYFARSMFMMKNRNLAAIDAVPVLTETGGGAQMAFFEGVAADSTEELAGTWCGDLLQIVDKLPGDYEPIDCCFAEIWNRVELCYHLFGADAAGYVLNDRNEKRYECAELNLAGVRKAAQYIKIESTEGKIQYIPERISDPAEEKKT
jgi:hypothetical protein